MLKLTLLLVAFTSVAVGTYGGCTAQQWADYAGGEWLAGSGFKAMYGAGQCVGNWEPYMYMYNIVTDANAICFGYGVFCSAPGARKRNITSLSAGHTMAAAPLPPSVLRVEEGQVQQCTKNYFGKEECVGGCPPNYEFNPEEFKGLLDTHLTQWCFNNEIPASQNNPIASALRAIKDAFEEGELSKYKLGYKVGGENYVDKAVSLRAPRDEEARFVNSVNSYPVMQSYSVDSAVIAESQSQCNWDQKVGWYKNEKEENVYTGQDGFKTWKRFFQLTKGNNQFEHFSRQTLWTTIGTDIDATGCTEAYDTIQNAYTNKLAAHQVSVITYGNNHAEPLRLFI